MLEKRSTALVVLVWIIAFVLNPLARAQDLPKVEPEVAWTFQTGAPIWGSSSSKDGIVYFGSTDSLVYALDVATGDLVWSVKTGGPIYASVKVHEDYLYAASDDGFVYKLALEDGAEIWRANTHEATPQARHRPADTPPGNQRWDYHGSAPIEVDGVVYVGSADNRVYALQADTGEKVWHFETGNIVRSTPAVADGKVVFGSFDGRVYAVDQATGEEIWRYAMNAVVSTSAAVFDGKVFIGSRNTRLYALDLENGEVVWTYQYGNGSWVESAGVVYDSTLYIGSSFWSMRLAIDPQTGSPRWLRAIGGATYGVAGLTEDAHYVGAIGLENTLSGNMKGAILRLDRATGRIVWRYGFEVIPGHYDHGVMATPEVVDDLVLFGGLDDVFYALREVRTNVGTEQDEVPVGFELGQNYPNPFNPTTTIRVSLDAASPVTLAVYDLQGRLVREIVNGYLGPGTTDFTWNGRDARAQAVASGVYVYRLTVGDRTEARKMVLLR